MHITQCARSKILQLLEPSKALRIQATGSTSVGVHVDLLLNEDVLPSDGIITQDPLIVADLQSMTLLANRLVDFDNSTAEFIISNRGK